MVGNTGTRERALWGSEEGARRSARPGSYTIDGVHDLHLIVHNVQAS